MVVIPPEDASVVTPVTLELPKTFSPLAVAIPVTPSVPIVPIPEILIFLPVTSSYTTSSLTDKSPPT